MMRLNIYRKFYQNGLKLHKEKDLFINKECLYWECLYIIEGYKNWNSLIKNYPNELANKVPFHDLIYNNHAYESTVFIINFKPRFFFYSDFI